jgi:hypothetical protein
MAAHLHSESKRESQASISSIAGRINPYQTSACQKGEKKRQNLNARPEGLADEETPLGVF